LNHPENTSTTTDASLASEAAAASGRSQMGVVEWDVSDLLIRNLVSAKTQKLLLDKGLTAQTLISWLLYAASPAGRGIRDPIAHAISRLIQAPARGAGGAYDQLAHIPMSELADLLTTELNGGYSINPTWRKAMQGTPRARLQALADQLGIDPSDQEA
jgi:hypothetical protein